MEIKVRSKRDTGIPVSIFESDHGNGLLLMAHSFKSDRSENKRFDEVAENLRRYGYHTVSFDFPGNGESEEDFLNYSLRNCLDDMESVYEYMKNHYSLDRKKLALLGYSMGGRLISLFYGRHPEFNELVFWAACNQDYGLEDRFLEQDLSELKKQCDEKGYCDFYDIFEESYSKMSAQFVYDMISLDALSPLDDFKGRALIVQGKKDTTIDIDNAQMIYDHLSKANERSLLMIPGADHGFGLWDDRPQDSEVLVSETVSFLKRI